MSLLRAALLWIATGGMGFLATCALMAWTRHDVQWSQGLLEAALGALASLGFVGGLASLWSRHRMEWLTSPFRFLHRLNHEATHAIAALLTGGGIASLTVNPNGGSIQLGRRGVAPFLVAIAPYLVSLPLVAFLILEVSHPHPLFRVGCGAAFLYHVLATLAGLTPRMADFRGEPFPAVAVWVLGGLVLTSGAVLTLVSGGAPECLRYAASIGTRAGDLVRSGAVVVSHLLT